MGEKKKPGRFTLQFSIEDPQQRMVSELLEQQGRHKAQFITNAIMLYIQHPKPQGHNSGSPAVDEAVIERLLLSILEKHSQFTAAASGELLGAEDHPAPMTSAKVLWEDAMGNDALKAINDTLAAFQKR